ncbi:hypothetical protein diail_11628 [Diaporthe ilicicola]|nr:hypothetical protein diail_11628 [Diaporthe ilicicola]
MHAGLPAVPRAAPAWILEAAFIMSELFKPDINDHYNESLSFDNVLHKQDILGSIAFARANTKASRLTQDEFAKIEAGLLEVEKEWESGTFKSVPGADEDIHTANERRLGEIIGKEIAGKLHTGRGRSRNEQIATDVSAGRAESEIDYVMPGYTHLAARPAHCGKSGRAFGHMAGFMMTLKGLPSTYNKDLQESVEPLLDHVKTVDARAALDPFILATDVADYLVRKGVPFRKMYHISGQYVALSEQTGTPINELIYKQMKGVDARFEEDIAESFDYEKSVEMRAANGGTSKAFALEQVKVLTGMIA